MSTLKVIGEVTGCDQRHVLPSTHDNGTPRYLLYNGGAYKYRMTLQQVAESGYAAMDLS